MSQPFGFGLQILTVWLLIKAASRFWLPRTTMSLPKHILYMLVVVATNYEGLLLHRGVFTYTYKGTDDSMSLALGLTVALASCWFMLLGTRMMLDSSTASSGVKTHKDRICWVYCFWRRQFVTDYRPWRKMPFSWILWFLGLTPLVDGFVMEKVEAEDGNGDRVKATVVVKATGEGEAGEFNRDALQAIRSFRDYFQKLCATNSEKSAEAYGFRPCISGISSEVQKITILLKPVSVPRPA